MLARLAGTSARSLARPRAAPLASFLRHGSSQTIRSAAALIDPAVLSRDDGSKSLHGRYASIAPPTRAQTLPQPEFTEVEAADHAWRQTNHIWSNDELDKVSIEKHEPVTVSDHLMKGVMNVLYHGFNFVTGYDPVDPSVAASLRRCRRAFRGRERARGRVDSVEAGGTPSTRYTQYRNSIHNAGRRGPSRGA